MSKKTIFNSNNTGHVTKTYQMFFGDSLGLGDTVNVVNKRLERLKEQQRAKGWFPTEVSMVQDRIDMLKVPKDTADLMVKTILWQAVTDSIASRGIGAMLLPHLTNTEAVSAVAEWNRIECLTGDHEVLTPNGWKFITEVTTEDEVAQWDKDTRELKFVNPTDTIKRPHKGKLYHFTDVNGNVDQMVTPNHRMPFWNKECIPN